MSSGSCTSAWIPRATSKGRTRTAAEGLIADLVEARAAEAARDVGPTARRAVEDQLFARARVVENPKGGTVYARGRAFRVVTPISNDVVRIP